MKVTLPNGLLDGQDHFNIVVIDELRGKQQNYLADRTLIQDNIGHVPKILEDLVLSIETKEGIAWQGNKKDAIWKLPASDIETLLIKLRENTFGNRYYFDAVCTHCGHINKNRKIDLSTLKISKFPTKSRLDVSKRTLTLPKSKKVIVLKPMFLKDMFDSLKIAKDGQDKLITSVVSLSISTIDGSTENIRTKVEDFPMSDIFFIEESMEKIKLEGAIDTELTIDCSECKKDFDTDLNVYSPDFFYPSRRSKNSTT